MSHLDRLEKLTALLAIGFAWAHKVGEWFAPNQKQVYKFLSCTGEMANFHQKINFLLSNIW